MQIPDIIEIKRILNKMYKNNFTFTGSLPIAIYSLLINKPFRNINDVDIFVFNQKDQKAKILFYNYDSKTYKTPKAEEIKQKHEIAIDITEKFNHDFIEPRQTDTIKIKLDNETIKITKPEYILCFKLFKKRAIRNKDKFDILYILNNIKLDLKYLNSLIEIIPFYKNLLKKYSIEEILHKIKNNEIYNLIERELDKKYNCKQIEDINKEEKNILLNFKAPKIYPTLFETIFYNLNPKSNSKTANNILNILSENKRNQLQNRSSYYLYSSCLYKKTKKKSDIIKFATTKKPMVFYFKKIN